MCSMRCRRHSPARCPSASTSATRSRISSAARSRPPSRREPLRESLGLATRRFGNPRPNPLSGDRPSMRVMVTGNLGYVGTVMTPLLHAAGFEVWGLDTGYFRDCVLGPLGPSGVARQIERDVREVAPTDLQGVDAVVHLAALSNDPMGEL